MEKAIRVQILGREYPLRVREEDEPLARKVAVLVDERMKAVRKNINNQPEVTVAVLAAMAIAEELMLLQQAGNGTEGVQASDLDALADRLDEVLSGNGTEEPEPVSARSN